MPVIAAVKDQHAQHGPEHVGRRRRRGARASAAAWSRLADHDVVGDRVDHGLELGDRQELQVGRGVAAAASLRSRRTPHRVLVDPTAIESVLRHRVQEAEDVPHRLGLQAGSEHPVGERLDVGGRDLRERPASERGREMDPLHRVAVLEIRLAGALQRELSAERLRRLVERDPRVLDGRARPLLLLILQDPEAPLGLDTGQAVGEARRAHGTDAPVQPPTVARPPAAVVRPMLLVESPGSVAALPGHARDDRARSGRTREPSHPRGWIVRDSTQAATLPWSNRTLRPTLRNGIRRLRVSW